MSDNEGEGSERGREKEEMGQEAMAKAWKIWVRQFDWYAAASRFTLKNAEVQVGICMFSFGPGVTEIFDAFGVSAKEEKVVATIRRRLGEHFTRIFHYKGRISLGCGSWKIKNLMSILYKLKHKPRSVNLVSWKTHW
jgi:hypothetical protein